MAKLDLSDAYGHILVLPHDWPLLGFSWPMFVDESLGMGYFFDMFEFLFFGSRGALALFLRYADAPAFIMTDRIEAPS